MRTTDSQRRGFTLIELLVVIAIILILVSMLMPAIKVVQKNAKRARAMGDVATIANGLKQYYGEYQQWAATVAGGDETNTVGGIPVNSNLVDLLGGQDISGDNPRLKLFMQVPPQALDSAGTFIDPWRNAYKYMCDFNYNGALSITFTNASTTNVANVTVGVWSSGQDGVSGTPAQRADDLVTWQ
jgi:prepilin-type N-terminal cleavage/methylation domain-containing protein